MPTNDVLIEVVEGPQGKAELHEVQESASEIVYEVRYDGKSERFDTIGEAYIEAGLKVGKET